MFRGRYHNTISHHSMISDTYRTLSWNFAIKETVLEGDTVIDFGAGSGILSLFALQAGAKHVYCIERNTNARRLCSEILKSNGYDNFTIVDDYKLLPKIHIDVILSESIGDHLIENYSMKIFLNLCKEYKPRDAIPNKMSLHVYPEVLVKKHNGINEVENTTDLNLQLIKDSILPNPILDTGYFEQNTNTDLYWKIDKFYNIDEQLTTIIDFEVPNIPTTDDGYIRHEFEVDTKGLIEYGILVYWTATLSENYVIHNHPSRIGKQNHSYYQRILNIYNPSKRLKNKVTFILDLDYDDEAHEDKPCQNLKITVN